MTDKLPKRRIVTSDDVVMVRAAMTLREFKARHPGAVYNLNQICEPWMHEWLANDFAHAWITDKAVNPDFWAATGVICETNPPETKT